MIFAMEILRPNLYMKAEKIQPIAVSLLVYTFI